MVIFPFVALRVRLNIILDLARELSISQAATWLGFTFSSHFVRINILKSEKAQ